MSRLFIPNHWDDTYYPTALDLVYEVEASIPSLLDMSNVVVKNRFPIHTTKKYLLRGSDPEFDYSGSDISFQLELSLMTQPKFGSVTIEHGVGFVYTPRPGFLGKDTFRYHLLVTKRSSTIGTVEVFVGVQARYPTCTTTYPAKSETLQEGVGLGYQIHLCKPAYSEFTIGLPIRLSEFIGEVYEESEDPESEGEITSNIRFLDIVLKDLDFVQDDPESEDDDSSIIYTSRYEFDAKAAQEELIDNIFITLNRPRLRNFLIIISKGLPPEEEDPESYPFIDFTSVNIDINQFSIKLL